ncbi:MAG TPA: NADPH:quinone reductase [Vicinamibacterales bacterium]|nr:NADPH:quinone reductase [Vicinamibacterales bacterium]
MKAIRVHEVGEPQVMRLEDVADPKPGAGEVLVRIHAAGINPVDAYIRAGTYPRKPALPYIPGSDGAGEVEAVGAGVHGFAPGDRVYFAGFGDRPAGAGTYAERTVGAPSQLFRLPSNASFAEGAALGVPYSTAYRALFQRADAKPGETVLVHGATGGVGIAAVELAHARGLRVIGTGGTDDGLAAVRERGADVTVKHSEPGYEERIKQATGGAGVDLVLEMAAHVNLDRDLSLLAKHGRVVVIGNRGRVEIDPRQAMARDAAVLGMTLFNATQDDLVEIHAALFAGLQNRTLKPLVGREHPLSDASKAHEQLFKPGALGKIVLVP